jgi:hypothetical protein
MVDTQSPQPIEFESKHEQELLTALMTAGGVQSFVIGLLVKRYPKWGFRWAMATVVLCGAAAVAHQRGDVVDE